MGQGRVVGAGAEACVCEVDRVVAQPVDVDVGDAGEIVVDVNIARVTKISTGLGDVDGRGARPAVHRDVFGGEVVGIGLGDGVDRAAGNDDPVAVRVAGPGIEQDYR